MQQQVMEKERTFVRDAMEWPRWPVLPLKRRNGGDFADADYCGFLFDNGKPKVYIGIIFGLGGSGVCDGKKTWGDVLAPLPTIEYPDFDAMLEVWKVD